MSLAEKMVAVLIVCSFVPVAAEAKVCPKDTAGLPRRIVSCRPSATLDQCRVVVEEVSCSVVRELESIHALVITVPAYAGSAAEEKIAAAPEVRRLEDDPYVKWLSAEALAMPRFEFPPIREMLPGLSEMRVSGTDTEQPWGVKRVRAAKAWSKTQGRGVKVAVIDTGIDAAHPDLAPNLKGGVNLISAKASRSYQDDQGHGSHVAGTIAAARNGKGVVGVAPEASLYAVKVLDSEGGGNYSDIIAGIEWCVNNGMDVANMSLGAYQGTEALHEAVIQARKAGLVIVAAAGNDSGGPVGFPAAYAETIAVSASTDKDKFAPFSSKGKEVDFIAPGQNILSAQMGGGVVANSGTSMATPHVAGLAALAVAAGKHGAADVTAALKAAASRLPGLPGVMQGAGMIDAGKLVR